MISPARSNSLNQPIVNKQLQTTSIVTRAIRFACTGVLVTGIHILIAMGLFQLLHNSPLANGGAFVVATLTSYLINTTWSFSNRLHGKTLIRFTLVSMLGLWSALWVAWIVQALGFDYRVGIGAVAMLIPPMTFLLHHFWTYR